MIGVSGATQVDASDSGGACARLADGTVTCWGYDTFGVLDQAATWEARDPAPVPGLTDVAEVALGGGHTCVLRLDGTVSCWGRNQNGQLGDGTTETRSEPTRVAGLDRVVAIALGGQHSCALRDDGAVWCWGGGFSGQLGDGSTQDRPTPAAVDVPPAAHLGAGGSFTCAALRDGRLMCWGNARHGQLGVASPGKCPDFGSEFACATRPTVVPLQGVGAVAAGLHHACALRAGAGVSCWGAGGVGQLGHGTTDDSPAPAVVVWR